MRRARPLVVTADPDLLDDALRLATAAGVEVDVAVDRQAAGPTWPESPLILVGADVAATMADAAFPRRPGVLLLTLGSPEAGLWQRAVAIGAEGVLGLPAAQDTVAQRLAECAAGPASPAHVVGVVGGCGGAGASVLSVCIGLVAARLRPPALLIDVDPAGGGIDLVLGLEEQPGLRWPDLAEASGRLSPVGLRDALPSSQALAILSCGRPAQPDVPEQALRTIVAAGRRGGGVVVLDLPRHPTSAAGCAIREADDLLVVVRGEVRAVAAALRVVTALTDAGARPRAVVRCSVRAGLSADAVADALSIPLAGELRNDPRLQRSLEEGRPLRIGPRAALVRVAERLLPAASATHAGWAAAA